MFNLPEEIVLHLHTASLGGIIGTVIAVLFFLFSTITFLLNPKDKLALRYLVLEILFFFILLGFSLYQSTNDLARIDYWARLSFSGLAFAPVGFRLIINWILKVPDGRSLFHHIPFGIFWAALIGGNHEWMRIVQTGQEMMSDYPFQIEGPLFTLFILYVTFFLFYDWVRLIRHFWGKGKVRGGTGALVFGSSIWVWLFLHDALSFLTDIPYNDPFIWAGPTVMMFTMGLYYAQAIQHQAVSLDRLTRENDLFYQQMIRDDLTGVYSRNYFNSILRQEFEEHLRYKVNHSLLFIDMDDFKLVNDSLGHQIGDKVLVDLTKILVEHTRSSDLVARFGGDEFVVLLMNCDIDKAVNFANRIISHYKMVLAEHASEMPDTMDLPGLSIGVSHTDFWLDEPESIINQADDAMYKAKASGKNTVMYLSERVFDSSYYFEKAEEEAN